MAHHNDTTTRPARARPRNAAGRLLAAGVVAVSVCAAQTAVAEVIYRGLLEANGVLDLRENRFNFGGGGLSFNKQLAQILAAPANFNCALALYTDNPIPNVGDHSLIYRFGQFQATFDQNPPAPPLGHVSVTPAGVVANPAREFANDIKAEAMQDPERFNETSIFGVHQTDDDCRDKPKWLNGQ